RDEVRTLAVNRPAWCVGWNGFTLIDWLAEHVEDTAERSLAHGDGDWSAGIRDLHAALNAVRGTHGHRANDVAANVLLNLGNETHVPARLVLRLELERIVQLGEILALEFNVENRSNDLNDFPDVIRYG